MKALNILFLSAILILSSCSKPILERKAMERIPKALTERLGGKVKNHDASNFEIVFCDDSLCIVHYDLNVASFSDEKLTTRCEYYIMRTFSKDEHWNLVECTYSLSDRKSIIDRVSKECERPVMELEDASHQIRYNAITLDFFRLVKINHP